RATILCASRLSVSSKGSGINMVEGLDDLRGWQMRLQEFGRGGRFVVELGDVAVTLRVVIVGVDHDFACQRLDWNLPVVLQRHRNDDNVSSLCCLDGSRRAGFWTELCDEHGQCLRP